MNFSHLHKVLDDPNATISIKQCRSFLYTLLDQSTRNSDECDLHDEFDSMRYYDGAATAYRLALELLSHVKPYESRALKPCPACGKTSRSGYVSLWSRYHYGNLYHFIKCEHCSCQSTEASTEAQARRNWNNGLLKQRE